LLGRVSLLLRLFGDVALMLRFTVFSRMLRGAVVVRCGALNAKGCRSFRRRQPLVLISYLIVANWNAKFGEDFLDYFFDRKLVLPDGRPTRAAVTS
jgi:hypothetical protein